MTQRVHLFLTDSTYPKSYAVNSCKFLQTPALVKNKSVPFPSPPLHPTPSPHHITSPHLTSISPTPISPPPHLHLTSTPPPSHPIPSHLTFTSPPPPPHLHPTSTSPPAHLHPISLPTQPQTQYTLIDLTLLHNQTYLLAEFLLVTKVVHNLSKALLQLGKKGSQMSLIVDTKLFSRLSNTHTHTHTHTHTCVHIHTQRKNHWINNIKTSKQAIPIF